MFYLVPVPKQFVDFSGVPYSGGSVTVYVHGTTDKALIYAEAGSTVLLNNPCQLDSNGSWKCFVPADIPLDYIVQDRDENVVASYMNIVMPLIDTAVTKGYVDAQDQLINENLAAETSRAQGAEASARTEVVQGENCTIEKTTAADGHDVYTVNADGKPQVQSDWNQSDSSKTDYIKNKPNLNLKADKVQGATAGNLAALDATGNLMDSGENIGDFKTKQTAVTDPTADGTGLSFIDSITQNANGEITSHKKTVQDGTTTQKGVVKLNNAINSTSTTEAATPKAVKDAYDDLNNKIVARATFLSQAEWAVQSLLPGDPAKVYYVENSTGEDAYTVYVWKASTSEYVEVDESSIDLDGYWHDGPTTTGGGNVVTGITLGNDGVPQVVKGITALTQHQSVTNSNPTLAWGSTSTVGTVGNTNLQVTMPSNPASGKADNSPTFTEAATRENLNGSNETMPTILGKIKKWFTDLKALAFKDTASYNDLSSGVQSSLDSADSALQEIVATAGPNIGNVGTPSVTASTDAALKKTTLTFNYLKGNKGDPGTNGTNGTNGTSAYWFSGTAVTGTGTGISATVSGSKAGDMYLNTSTQNVYKATAANTWNYVTNIKGATGAISVTSASSGSFPLLTYDSGIGKYNSNITLDLSKASAEVYSLGTNAKVVNGNTYVRVATIEFESRDDAACGITGFAVMRDQNVSNSGEAIFAISCADYGDETPKGKLITLNVRNSTIIGLYLGVKKISSSTFELWAKFARYSTSLLQISINKTSTSTVTWNNDSASAKQPSGDYYEMRNCTLVESSGTYPNMTVGKVVGSKVGEEWNPIYIAANGTPTVCSTVLRRPADISSGKLNWLFNNASYITLGTSENLDNRITPSDTQIVHLLICQNTARSTINITANGVATSVASGEYAIFKWNITNEKWVFAGNILSKSGTYPNMTVGNATRADKVSNGNVGSPARPVYANSDGYLEACTYGANVGSLSADSTIIDFV